MLYKETGFTLGGLHSRDDMGLIYVEKEGHIVIPEIKRNTYTIAGVSGQVLFPGETWQPFNLEGTLYPAREPKTQAEAQRLIRRVTAWLTAGRNPLIFDYEPEVFYLVELSAATKWSLRNWFGGELQIRWTAQPYAYAVTPDTASAEITGTSCQLQLRVRTRHPAPLILTIENTGGAPITRVDVGSGVSLRELYMMPDQVMTITMEPPIGAVIDGESALSKAVAFDPVLLDAGDHTVSVHLTYDSDAPGAPAGAKISASVRGRW